MQGEDKAWLEWKNNFSDIYDDLNYTDSIQSRVMRASHKFAEKAFSDQVHFSRVLEVGAGTGEHLPFVIHSFDEYILTDFDQKALDIANNKYSDKYAGKLKFQKQSGEQLSYNDNVFDRVIATHILEHIYQPHLVVKEWARVLKNNGILTVLLPTDPGLGWRMAKHFGPRRNAILKGIPYDFIMAREHVNSCTNLVYILRHYFPDMSEGWWPLRLASVDINLFYVAHIRVHK